MTGAESVPERGPHHDPEPSPNAAAVQEFWARARAQLPALPETSPPAWAFGATRRHADELLELMLAGTKTGTASSLWDHEHTGEPVPRPGALGIVLDGGARPRAVIETTSAVTVPFDEVTEGHARAEGEGDRTLARWREVHERFWRQHAQDPRGWAPDMPVVCELFRVLYSEG